MAQGHVWGTKVELFALATVLIAVYYKPSPAEFFKWQVYCPAEKDASGYKTVPLRSTDQCIYLFNSVVHFDRVVMSQLLADFKGAP